MQRRRRLRGFTLIELLVVISIIGILVGLLLPAVNSAREAGRRAQCQSNMRNVVLGILGYVNQKNVFPAAGTFGEDAKTDVTNPSTSVIVGFLTGTPRPLPAAPMYSWVVSILPYLDSQESYNQWSMFSTDSKGNQFTVPYYDGFGGNSIANLTGGQASNYKISTSSIGVLRCPDDTTYQADQGNLSYVVNGGFALWHGTAVPYGWAGSAIDGGAGPVPIAWAGLTNTNSAISAGICQKLGVMFLESTYPQGNPTRVPWNIRSTLNSMVDGASSTILISENTLTGASTGNNYSSNLETNWATPMPNFSMFIGSSNVCTTASPVTTKSSLDCTLGQTLLQPTGDNDGPAWAYANKVGTLENINFGQNLTLEGSFPFSNSSHPGGTNMGFCDGGVRFISNTIDGTVYSKIITPSGSRLPLYAKQMPVSQDSFVP
jgi:prepilin-type N-terminal cleavage/methylation domain-containing protein/prepilin-type processing-associated H-X9-DG protein